MNIFTAMYKMFSKTDKVKAYTDILNTAKNLIFMRATHVVKYPNILKNTAFDKVVNRYIIKQ